jgi:hypothetical protein
MQAGEEDVIMAEPGLIIPQETNVLQSFSDATAGRSQQMFYAVAAADTVSTKYLLIRDSGISNPAYQFSGGNGDVIDVDFDITINKPTIIAGLVAVDVTFETLLGGFNNMYIKFKLYYVSTEAVETEIGAVRTPTNATTPYKSKVVMAVTKKMFGVGTKLRLNAIVNNNQGTGNATMWHDPTTAGHELKIWIPVVNLE